MTVAELIEKLKEMPQDSLVLVSSDGEGNDIMELVDVENACRCEQDDDSRGYDLIHPDDNDEDDPRGEECVVLWP